MDNFWKWFENKTGFMKIAWMSHNRENWKINLIGHMVEYLFINGYDTDILNAESQMAPNKNGINIQWYYDYLESIIYNS